MATTATAEDRGGRETLARLPRRNFKTGAEEELRYDVGEFKGKLLLGARIWYRGARPTPEDDGFRPSKDGGLTVREHELDDVIAALEAVRARVHAEGRETCATPKPPRGGPGEWRSDAGLPRPPARRQVERPTVLPSDEDLDASARRASPPWEGGR